jgi:predicted nucleic acid-binding protein
MTCRSCLNNPTTLIVADASVVINLNATGFSAQILDALPNRFLVVEQVLQELEDGRRNEHRDADALSTLVAQGRIEIVRLGDVGMTHFIDLVSGSAVQTLDDGEAATIAYALEQGGTTLIDERKANKICADRFNELPTGCTIDLLAHTDIQAAIGPDGLADAVFNALHHGRMQVLPHHVDWVVGLIGAQRAAKCRSLPKSIRAFNKSVGG